MSLFKKFARWSVSWFSIGMMGVLLLSVFLHFWGLGRFNTLVFDEVYYVKYAHNYLTRTPFFDAHPPLGKYAIALGIWIGSHFPGGRDAINNLGAVPFPALTYRWFNALTGSLLPLVVGAIAYHLSHRRSYALIAALFTAVDGLFLVESRYALINIYLVFFGLLGQWFFLLALENRARRRWFWLALSGICFGGSVSVKWNGLGFLLGIYLVWICAWVIRWVRGTKGTEEQTRTRVEVQRRLINAQSSVSDRQLPLLKLTQINLAQMLLNLGFIPAIVYRLVWIPHLQINSIGFQELHKQILGFHQGLGESVHPYCSRWYTWPLMIRPMSYFYETARNLTEPMPFVGPPLPAGAGKVIYDVHAIGNPPLWWLSTIAIVLLVVELVKRIRAGFQRSRMPANQETAYFPLPAQNWIALYLVLNYVANVLPWIKVTRCTFIYLYMGAVIFAFLSIAWLVDRWLIGIKGQLRAMGVTAIFLILLAFVFWVPIYWGLPLSPEGFQIRMWFRSWY